MERIRISRSLEPGKYLIIAIAVILLVVLFYSYKETNALICCITFLALLGLLYYLFSIAKTVEFDEQDLFISNKNESEVIPLNKVFGIKFTMTRINNNNFWKIKYVGNDGNKKAVRILPKRDKFDAFKKLVKEKNPGVEIKNWSHSFDFDQ